MADDVDLMQDREQIFLDHQLKVRKPEGPPANGKCLTCETPLGDQRRWCDADCRDDFERSFLSPR